MSLLRYEPFWNWGPFEGDVYKCSGITEHNLSDIVLWKPGTKKQLQIFSGGRRRWSLESDHKMQASIRACINRTACDANLERIRIHAEESKRVGTHSKAGTKEAFLPRSKAYCCCANSLNQKKLKVSCRWSKQCFTNRVEKCHKSFKRGFTPKKINKNCDTIIHNWINIKLAMRLLLENKCWSF